MKKYVRGRASSFTYAFKGLHTLVRTQPNMALHLAAAIIALGLGLYFRLAGWEWVALIFAITLVWLCEALNTALEYLTDLVQPGYHPLAGKVKDVAAAAVLIASLGALAVGIVVFYPHIAGMAGK